MSRSQTIIEEMNKSETPSKNLMSEAYYFRDIEMGLTFEERKCKTLKKLYSEDNERYIELNKITDHYEFYKAMTEEELNYIGW